MSHETTWFRSQHLLDRNQSALVVIDVQESLTPKVMDPKRLLWNIGRLLRAAAALKVPAEGTEQYPQGLKSTVAELLPLIPVRHEKTSFSIAEIRPLIESFANRQMIQLVLCGIETHICILQSAADLVAEGYQVHVVVDATSARQMEDHSIALERMRDLGITLTTTEAVLFEWCKTARAAEFKTIRAIVQESAPGFPRHVGFNTSNH